MKKILAAILAGILALSLIACDESSYSTSSSTSSGTIDDILGEIEKFVDNALEEGDNTTFTAAGIELSIPNYYDQMPENMSGDTSITDFEVTEGDAILVRLRIATEDLSVSQNEFENAKDIISSNIVDDNEISDSNDITIAGLSGRSFSFTTSNENVDVLISHAAFAYNIAEKKLLCVFIIAPENLMDEYIDDYNKIIETAKLVPTDNLDSKDEQPSNDNQTSNSTYYSTNDLETAKKGNSGVFAYKKSGKLYNMYWIIDFDEGYVYCFTDGDEGNGMEGCDRLKIDSGDLNSVLIITYHDGGDSWSNGLHFKWKNQPDIMIHEDNYGFETKFTATDLDDALAIRDTKTIKDY